MIIDAHIHLWNRLHGDDLGTSRRALSWGRAEQEGRVYYATPPSFHDSLSTVERALAHMDWLGVDRAVVLQEFMDGKQDDYLSQVIRDHPDRFCPMALFDWRCYENPWGAFRARIDDLCLRGFLVKTPNPFPEVSASRLMPLWEACQERGLPVVLKNGDTGDVDRLATRLPDLRIVLSHFGGFRSEADADRLSMICAHKHVTLDSGGLQHQMRYPFPHAQEVFQQVVESVGAERIAWGSDYPRPTLVADVSYRQQLEFITVECGFLDDTQREQILGGTALRVYPWTT